MAKSVRSHRFKPLVPLAGAVAALMSLGIVATLADLVYDIHLLGLFNEAVDGSDSAFRTLEPAADTSAALYYANAVILLVTGGILPGLGLPRPCECSCPALRRAEIHAGLGSPAGGSFLSSIWCSRPGPWPSCIGSPKRAILRPVALHIRIRAGHCMVVAAIDFERRGPRRHRRRARRSGRTDSACCSFSR